jgi:2-keto-4-pentenoate hydratase
MTMKATMRAWLILSLVTFCACSSDRDSAPAVESSPSNTLSPSSTDAEIMEHLYQAELDQRATDALTTHFPDMTRDRAYAIQKLRLEHREKTSRRVGWKIGWSRQANPDDELDPVVGHVMEDRLYTESEPISTRYFTEGSTGAEAEVVFYLNKDLPGPEITAEEVADAVEAVGIAMEFVSGRLTQPHEREHAVADNVYGAGVVLGAERFELDDIDFTEEIGQVDVNGEILAEGPATSIMGKDPFAALVWIANELPKHGWYLHAGDFVVTGTVCQPPPVKAGDSARVTFTNLGSVSAEFID